MDKSEGKEEEEEKLMQLLYESVNEWKVLYLP